MRTSVSTPAAGSSALRPGAAASACARRPAPGGGAWSRRHVLHACGCALLLAATALPAQAQTAAAPAPLELLSLASRRADEGVLLSFAVRIKLPAHVEEALVKGVPMHFTAEAELVRQRWYWADKRMARASRTWRVAWQPLTRTWRVSFGGLQQRFDTLADALGAISRAASWKIAEPLAADDDRDYRVEFSYRLDTALLPRPLQIGLGGPTEWDMGVQRTVPVPEAGAR